MYIIYGAREYGRIDEHGGEHGSTTFFHIWFAPLIPLSAHWTTPTGKVPMRWSGKSVAAGYLRVWGPIAALGCFSAGLASRSGVHLAPLVAGLALVAASVWSWTWRSLRGAAAKRRSDFNFVAYGTRCEPARMQGIQRATLKRELDKRWTDRALAGGSADSPNEIAQRGPTDATEATLAYGLLRLASIERGRAGAADAADADRLLAGEFAAPETMDGPYRAGPAVASAPAAPATDAALANLVEAKAAETAHPVPHQDPIADRRRKRRRSRLQAVGLVFLSMAMLGAIAGAVSESRGALDVGIQQLRSVKPPTGRLVRVTCDVVDDGVVLEYSGAREVGRIAMCSIGNYFVPVQLGEGDPHPGKVIEGKLRSVSDRTDSDWAYELHKAPEIEDRMTDVFVDVKNAGNPASVIAIAIALLVGTPLLWFLWFRARRRARAAELAPR